MKHQLALKKITIGFIASVLLTLEAFYLVDRQILQGWKLVLIIITLTVVQLGVQIMFFLHIDENDEQRFKLTTLFYALGTVVIVVAGSLWIISNLNYSHDRALSPEKQEQKIIEDEIFKP